MLYFQSQYLNLVENPVLDQITKTVYIEPYTQIFAVNIELIKLITWDSMNMRLRWYNAKCVQTFCIVSKYNIIRNTKFNLLYTCSTFLQTLKPFCKLILCIISMDWIVISSDFVPSSVSNRNYRVIHSDDFSDDL